MAYLIGPKLYMANIPVGVDRLDAGGFGVGKVVIDRPTITFRMPRVFDEVFYFVEDNLRNLGRRINVNVGRLFNSETQEYFLDKDVNYSVGSLNAGSGDGTIYRTLKEDIKLDGDANVNPGDGFRQKVTDLDPIIARGQQRRTRRRKIPKAGRSIRPRYSHLYR